MVTTTPDVYIRGGRVVCACEDDAHLPELLADGTLVCPEDPAAMDEVRHPGHELVRVSGRRDSGEMVGLLLCMTCARTVRRLKLCGAETKRGMPCRAFVRDDLGYDSCWSHGEGAGATNRPRVRRRAS